jgi:hypothetical protein
MYVAENLFGEFELVISRGSSKRKGILKYLHYSNYIDAIYQFSKLAKLRIKHGYLQFT